MTTVRYEIPHCTVCQGTDVTHTAELTWNAADRRFDIDSSDIPAPYCITCDATTPMVWADVEIGYA